MEPDFYARFYDVTRDCRIHSEFCEAVFGIDLSQHGFADKEQLDLLIGVSGMKAGQRAMDVGCGNGKIAEYLSDVTGTQVTGVDNCETAVRAATERTARKRQKLSFRTGDMNELHMEPQAYDHALFIDSIYFSEDYDATIRRAMDGLALDGDLLFFYSVGPALLGTNDIPAETLQARGTPLAQSLLRAGLTAEHWDLTIQDYHLARKRRGFLLDHKGQFEEQGAGFIYENRIADATNFIAAIEAGIHRRYLYRALHPSAADAPPLQPAVGQGSL